MTYSSSSTATPLEMTAAGVLGQVSGTDVTTSPYESTCFTAGPPVPVTIRPVTVSTAATPAGQTEIPIDTNPGDGVAGVSASVVQSDTAQSLTVQEADTSTGASSGFQIGEEVVIDPGGSNAEVGTIARFGSIILSSPLRYDHAAGEPIVALDAAPLSPAPTSSPAPSRSSSGGSSLAATGAGLVDESDFAALSALAGLLLVTTARPRRHRPVHRRRRAAHSPGPERP
jgi:hypothetical protein